MSVGVNVKQQPASYIYGLDGTKYYAINCATGAVTTNNNATTLLQACIDALTSGGKIVIKAPFNAYFTELQIGNGITIEGEMRFHNDYTRSVVLRYSGTGIFIKRKTLRARFELRNLVLWTDTPYPNASAPKCLVDLAEASVCTVDNCEIGGGIIGINLDGAYFADGTATTYSTSYHRLTNLRVIGNQVGIKIVGAQAANNYLSNIIIDSSQTSTPQSGSIGMLLDGTTSTAIINNGLNRMFRIEILNYWEIGVKITSKTSGNEIYGISVEHGTTGYLLENKAESSPVLCNQDTIFGRTSTNVTDNTVFPTKTKLNIQGYLTENSGSGTITAGSTYVEITHGLAVTPSIANIKLTSQDDLGGRTMYVNTIGATTFRINISTVDLVDHIISWEYDGN